MAAQLNDLAELVDDPNERLSAEYKAIVDFDLPEARAKLARHIAALANHGGGHIVVGFNDDLSPAATPSTAVDRDKVAAVVKTYLEPAIQCDVRLVTASTGRIHPIIVVPSRGATPICARADGPQDNKGRVQGIVRGVHYIRKAGPASEQILTAAEWGPVIRRCALHERTSILSAIDAALRGGDVATVQQERLEAWHAAAAKAYAADYKAFGGASDVTARHFQFSYLIDSADDGPAPGEIKAVVERATWTVDEKIKSGWGMFHVFHGAGGAAFATVPDVEGGEVDFLETNFIRNDSTVGATDLWRIAPDGRATLLRGYWEDSRLTNYGIAEGQVFSPNGLVQDLAEFVLHASTMATSFPNSSRILFRCEWVGLKGRTLHDPSARWMFSGHAAAEDRRLAKADVGVGEAAADWFKVVETLAGPVARAFGIGHVITADWIARQSPTWRSR